MGPGRRALVLGLAAPILALSACGGGDPDVAKIKAIVEAVAKDSAALCDHATAQLLGLIGGDKQACQESMRGYQAAAATAVEGDIDVHVASGTATADFTTADGTKRHVTFVKSGDVWLIDTVTG